MAAVLPRNVGYNPLPPKGGIQGIEYFKAEQDSILRFLDNLVRELKNLTK
jgi:hypothetical protein